MGDSLVLLFDFFALRPSISIFLDVRLPARLPRKSDVENANVPKLTLVLVLM